MKLKAKRGLGTMKTVSQFPPANASFLPDRTAHAKQKIFCAKFLTNSLGLEFVPFCMPSPRLLSQMSYIYWDKKLKKSPKFFPYRGHE
jgi:hypothetical protein